MSSTITVGSSSNWAQSFVGFKSLAIGNAQEPVVTSSNVVLQTITSPPFSFNWNRSSVTLATVAGQQDYATPVATFGFIEKASYQIPMAVITNTALVNGIATYTAANNFQAGDNVTVVGTSNGGGVFNITSQPIQTASSTQFTVLINGTVSSSADTGTATVGTTSEISNVNNILGTGSESGPPSQIAPQIDNNAGTITFRILPVPDRVYTVTVIFQQKTSLITSVNSTWAPIPDHYAYIYNWGFLAMMLAYNYDARWQAASQKFVASLLGVAEGLDEQDRNTFQDAWLNTITEQQARSLKTPQGVQSRQQE